MLKLGKLSYFLLLNQKFCRKFIWFTLTHDILKFILFNFRFQESQESISRCSSEDKDKEILVPLTGSMYVPGKLSEPEKVIVDIGTGYYVEKDLDSAKEYFSKKVKYVTEQMEKVQAIGNEKNKVREMVMDIMESKLQQQFAAQKQQGTAAK